MIDFSVELDKLKEELFGEEDLDIKFFKEKAKAIKRDIELRETPEPPDIDSIKKMIDLRPRKR